ncbi:hypothetical protein [Nitrosomonas eutropha]|nr:hypothetical protein [Nitrosomonas eutropha]PXV74500.1 hypothetical protein C8R14_1449 [Nitrosomonas eutropha]SEI42832.1 hypothetical protein SAMN05216318_102123 [Nitrosomonas eutropha]
MNLDWQLINSFSGWFSAAGTISAVVVSLYVSYSTRSTKISVTSGIYVFNENGGKTEYLGILVQNVGFRSFYINNDTCISIRVGWFRKRYIGIGRNHIDFTKSSNFPCKISEGEQAKLFIRLHDGQSRWIDGLKQGLLKGNSLSSLKIVVFPSIGKRVVRRFSREVMHEFKKT